MTMQELIDRYGLAELNSRTRISNDNLLNLLNEDYDAVGKANGLGFLKILEREFEVDLSGEKEKLKEAAKDATYVPKELLVTERKYKTGKKFAGGALIFILLALGLVYVVYLINNQNGFTGAESPTQTSTQPIEAIKEPTKQPEIVEAFSDSNISDEDANKTKSALDEENVQMHKVDNETNSSVKELEKEAKIVVVEDAVQQEDAEKEQEPVQEVEAEEKEAVEPKTIAVFEDIEEVVINPKKKLWLGMINLDTQQRVQKNKVDPIVIDENNTIIVTGHGWLEVAQTEFTQGERLYFHFVNKQLKQLNESAFKQLNEGRLW